MVEETRLELNHPWLVAVWPGMGHVAVNAGVYLLAKLGMTVIAELEGGDLFDVDHVEVKKGVIQPVRKPRNRFFLWRDPAGRHDLIVFVGEQQPPIGKFAFCRQIIRYARDHGVERVFTFAAMATGMEPAHRSRLFGAAADEETAREFTRLEIEPLAEGRVSGLNGVLLAAAQEANLRGGCLLGEMPQVFAQLPFPKASLGILEVFTVLSGIDLDLSELRQQAQHIEGQLVDLLERLQQAYREQQQRGGDSGGGGDEDEGPEFPATEGDEAADAESPAPGSPAPGSPAPRPRLTADQHAAIERLFDQASADRSKAFELKQLLDQLGVFKDYEDRFLDLFAGDK